MCMYQCVCVSVRGCQGKNQSVRVCVSVCQYLLVCGVVIMCISVYLWVIAVCLCMCLCFFCNM